MSDYDDLVAETMAKRPEVDAILTKKAQRARIASALRALRSRKGLSQRQLSARTGWSQPFIARIESIADDQMPAPETIVRYVEACGAKVGLVFLDQEDGKYRVGDAVALTDDAEAAGNLAELAEARFQTQLAGRPTEEAGFKRRAREAAEQALRLAEQAVQAAREEAEAGGFFFALEGPLAEELKRRMQEQPSRPVELVEDIGGRVLARAVLEQLHGTQAALEQLHGTQAALEQLLKSRAALEEQAAAIAVLREKTKEAGQNPRTTGRRFKRASEGRPSGKGAS